MGYKSSHIGLSAACISCARLLAAQTYTTVRRKQLLKLLRKIAAETHGFNRDFGCGVFVVRSPRLTIPLSTFLLLFAFMLRGSFYDDASPGQFVVALRMMINDILASPISTSQNQVSASLPSTFSASDSSSQSSRFPHLRR